MKNAFFDEVKKLAENTYGKVPRRSEPGIRKRAQEPVSHTARFASYVDKNVKQVVWGRNYLVPSYASDKKENAAALELLAEVLGSNTGRLYQKLVAEKGIAANASADYDGQGLDSGRFSISVTPKTEADFQAVEKEVDSVLADIFENGLKAEELERARSSLIASAIYAEDNQMALARFFGGGLTTGQTFEEIRNWPQKIAMVPLDDVRAAARFWLVKNRSVTGYLTYPVEKPVSPQSPAPAKETAPQ